MKSQISFTHSCVGLLGTVFLIFTSSATARGVSPYLPLNLEPEIERQIERVLILADKPVMTRPIAAATVFDALPKACEFDEVLCRSVEEYLQRYMHHSGVTRLRGELALTTGKSDRPVPNAHGMPVDSNWDVSAAAYYQPNDYFLFSVGGVAYEGDATPTGTVASLGWDFAQLDVGWRDHWLSPFTDSSMLISTEAPTMPSVTISNYQPFRFLGLQYQIFYAEMSKSDHITWEGGYTSGKPQLAGLHFQIEPTSGYALSVNRQMQYGGGARGHGGFSGFLDALTNPNGADNVHGQITTDQEFGNQQASLDSRLQFPAKVPFSIYFEYAGEDTSYAGNWRLGNVSQSMGIDFPMLGPNFDLTYEVSEWQNSWYNHHVYVDGMTNDGIVTGHWFGEERNTDVGGQSHMIRVGYRASDQSYLRLRYRTLQNASYTSTNYRRMHELGLMYSRPWRSYLVNAEVTAGRDVFGDSYGRIAASISYAQDWWRSGSGSIYARDDDQARVEFFLDGGAAVSRIHYYAGDVPTFLPSGERNPNAWVNLGSKSGPHFGVGVRRKIDEHNDLGARLELDEVNGSNLLSIRAVDYRYRFGEHVALGGFFGVGRYNLATPAYGYYLGAGAQWLNVLPHWDLNLDYRYYDKIARDKLLPSDPSAAARPDMFYDIDGVALYASWRF